MARARVTLKLDGSLKAFAENSVVTSEVQDELGSITLRLMLDVISKGLSPVDGVGRFEKYVAQRKVAPASKGRSRKDVSTQRKRLYPFSVQKTYPNKTLSPVNLYLDGTFLNSLTYRGTANGIELGHISPSAKTEALFEAHNEGLNKNVPQRKYLPNKRGEVFIVTIMRAIINVYSQRIKNIINGNR